MCLRYATSHPHAHLVLPDSYAHRFTATYACLGTSVGCEGCVPHVPSTGQLVNGDGTGGFEGMLHAHERSRLDSKYTENIRTDGRTGASTRRRATLSRVLACKKSSPRPLHTVDTRGTRADVGIRVQMQSGRQPHQLDASSEPRLVS